MSENQTGETSHAGRVCVFCGSSSGRQPAYLDAATVLGQAIADRGLGLVYGGANVGLMGRIAGTVTEAGREVIGVIPENLVAKEVAHHGLRDLRIVGSMHERKALMARLANAFIALPGGIGTLEELAEILTWAQLEIMRKPIGLLNIAGYYDGLLEFFEHAIHEGFLPTKQRETLVVSDDPDELLGRLL